MLGTCIRKQKLQKSYVLSYVLKITTNSYKHRQSDADEIAVANFAAILHDSASARKQKSLKILCFVICVEDYHKLTNTVFNPFLPRQSDFRVDTSLT